MLIFLVVILYKVVCKFFLPHNFGYTYKSYTYIYILSTSSVQGNNIVHKLSLALGILFPCHSYSTFHFWGSNFWERCKLLWHPPYCIWGYKYVLFSYLACWHWWLKILPIRQIENKEYLSFSPSDRQVKTYCIADFVLLKKSIKSFVIHKMTLIF